MYNSSKFDVCTNKQNKKKRDNRKHISSDQYGKVVKTWRMVTSEGAQKIYGGQHAGIVLLAYVGDHQYIKSSHR